MFDIENSLKPEKDSFQMHSWLNQHFPKISWKSTDLCLTCSKIVRFQVVFRKTEHGKRQTLTLSNNLSANQPQHNTRTSLQVRWQQSFAKFKVTFTKNAILKKSNKKTKWNSVSKLSKNQWIWFAAKLKSVNIFCRLLIVTNSVWETS